MYRFYSRGGMLLLLSFMLVLFGGLAFVSQVRWPDNEKLFSFLSSIALTFNGALIQFVTSKRDEKDMQSESQTTSVIQEKTTTVAPAPAKNNSPAL